jgi:hypothetical protein
MTGRYCTPPKRSRFPKRKGLVLLAEGDSSVCVYKCNGAMQVIYVPIMPLKVVAR